MKAEDARFVPWRVALHGILGRAAPVGPMQALPILAMRPRVTFTLAAVTTLLAGCTVVNIHTGAGVQTQVLPGVAKIVIPPSSERSIAMSTTGFGLVMGARATSVGWVRELAAELPSANECRLILLQPDLSSLNAMLAALKGAGADPNSFCNVQMKGD